MAEGSVGERTQTTYRRTAALLDEYCLATYGLSLQDERGERDGIMLTGELVASCLAHLRNTRSYALSYIKLIRSALKWVYPSSLAMDHPLVDRVIKGAAYETMDEGVRYREFPDYKLIQDLLRHWSAVPDETMELQRLLKKAVLLVRVGTGARGDDIWKIDLRHPLSRVWEGDQIRLVSPHPKGARPGRPSSWETMHALDTVGGCLCPVATLRAYLRRSNEWRVGGRGLFCSQFAASEDGRLSAQRLNSLMRELFVEAGMPAGKYTGHATRGMAVTAARAAGVEMDELMTHWHWQSKRTIRRHYDRSGTVVSLASKVIPCVEPLWELPDTTAAPQ